MGKRGGMLGLILGLATDYGVYEFVHRTGYSLSVPPKSSHDLFLLFFSGVVPFYYFVAGYTNLFRKEKFEKEKS